MFYKFQYRGFVHIFFSDLFLDSFLCYCKLYLFRISFLIHLALEYRKPIIFVHLLVPRIINRLVIKFLSSSVESLDFIHAQYAACGY